MSTGTFGGVSHKTPYNEYNHLSGYYQFDNVWTLKSYKHRRGQHLAEQHITLTDKAKEYVDQIIEITQPLRLYLRKTGDDNWRRLFLTSPFALSKPKPGNSLKHSYKYGGSPCTQVKARMEEFRDSANSINLKIKYNDKEVNELFFNTNLSSLRAQRAIQVYIETASLEKTRETLGHAKYDPDLIRHYLPESILDFFQERWIRLFQKGIICEAMKDSDYLSQASGFNNETELDEFLSNHALGEIPEYIRNPEHYDSFNDKLKDSPSNAIYISVDSSILLELLRIIQRVENKKETCTSTLLCWYALGKKLIAFIESKKDVILLRHLETAKNLLSSL